MDDKPEMAPMMPAETITIKIPQRLLREFQQDLRVVIKWPGLIGIPVPDVLLNRDLLGEVKDFEAILVPRQFMK